MNNSTITLSVDGELQEIRNDIAALLDFLQQQQRESLQVGEKIYNIGEIGQAVFQNIIQQAPFLPSKELTLPPFYPEVFIGREDDLKAIHHQLFNENNLLLLVNGEGGIGKTTIALRYYFTYQNDYQHLAWVFAEQSLLDALLTLSLPLGVDFPQAMPNTERLTLLLRKMANLQRPCLLIIDNANLLEDLERYYPQLSTCRNFHLLLTTRITQFEAAKTYAIQPLAPEKAIALFQQYYKTEETELLLQILPAVGYNTLVIELLAKNLKNFNQLKNRYSLSDLLQDLQQKGLLALQSKAVNTLYHSEGALRTEKPEAIIAAMYDLNELSEAERQLMSIFAVLPAENIPFETLETLLPDTEYLDDTLLALAQKGWLDYNETNAAFKCSPVIQEISRHKNQENLLVHCKTLLDSLIDKLDYEPGLGHILSGDYEAATLYARYGESVVNNIEGINNNIGILCDSLGNYHKTIGNLNNALNWFEQYSNCLQALTEAFPDNETYKNNLAISYEKLGATHSALGNLEQALRFFEEEQKLKEELFKDFPDNVRFKNGLAISYQYLG
ncbi:MAG: NB-ARC domain-containing protein, partial [Saprospiraceae bacterium]|nr:NB-ARC domain-containing protein [Saprospiraceae bacterium]